jgi:hypothetical protein
MIAVKFKAGVGQVERREDGRARVDIAGRLTTKDAWRTVCRVNDLSFSGVRVSTYDDLSPGSTIWIRLPGIDQRAAAVVWAHDFTAGCKFHDPLADAELDALTTP